MSKQDNTWNDYRVEQIIGVLLRVGVTSSAIIVLGAGLVYVWREHAGVTHYHHFHQEGTELTTITGVFRGAIGLDPLAIMQLGLLLLIATPVARVLFAVFAFMMERDWMYVIISLIVFAVLIASLTGVVV